MLPQGIQENSKTLVDVTEPRADPCIPESAGGADTGYTICTLCLEDGSPFSLSAVCWTNRKTVLSLFYFNWEMRRDSTSLSEPSGAFFGGGKKEGKKEGKYKGKKKEMFRHCLW